MNIGNTFEIFCDSTGVPRPIISWRINGKNPDEQAGSKSRYLVDVRDRHMSGLIECVASNHIGEPAVDGINLIVLCKDLDLI